LDQRGAAGDPFPTLPVLAVPRIGVLGDYCIPQASGDDESSACFIRYSATGSPSKRVPWDRIAHGSAEKHRGMHGVI
jgi:hypothetical protein